MAKHVQKHVKACQICQRAKDRTTASPGLLQPLPIPPSRFHSFSMDFITDLPACGTSKFNGIFTVVDRLTKFVRLIPIKLGEGELNAEHVATLFWQHVGSLFGVPSEVLHDRDPRFTSAFWQALWKLLGTKTVFSSAFHPQTDGQTERTHRTLEQCIRCLLSEHNLPDDAWCTLLPHVEFAINNTPNAST